MGVRIIVEAMSRREEGECVSEGSRALRSVMAERGWGPRAAAREIEVDAGMLSRWANGVARPDARGRVTCHRHFGIAFESWDVPPHEPTAAGSDDAA